MKNRISTKILLYFTGIVFATVFVTTVLVTFIAIFYLNDLNPISFSVILLMISIMIGTIISIIVGRKILTPITQLIEAYREVAKGNFAVKLPEENRNGEVKKVFHNFNLMVKELSSIETLRNDFVVNVSHEFKTPIAAIEGYATLLQDKGISAAEHEEYTKMIILSAKQLGALSGNVLNLSKLENQELVVDKGNFRLDEQIRQALLIFEKEWTEKDLALSIELPKVMFYGNQDLLMQVWMNLFGNAIKFSHEQGELEVTLTEEPENIVVTISDTGIGMTENIQRHIFEKFYQGDTSRSSDGNGLGLPLVKRIITLNGGSIHVKSEVGVGSVFTVKLPK